MSDIVNEALRQTLREDEEGLSAARDRASERAMSYEDFLGKLKADGTLGTAHQALRSQGPARHTRQ
jgi:hypothetical protein